MVSILENELKAPVKYTPGMSMNARVNLILRLFNLTQLEYLREKTGDRLYKLTVGTLQSPCLKVFEQVKIDEVIDADRIIPSEKMHKTIRLSTQAKKVAFKYPYKRLTDKRLRKRARKMVGLPDTGEYGDYSESFNSALTKLESTDSTTQK